MRRLKKIPIKKPEKYKNRYKNLHKLGFKTYEQYLSSPVWQEIRGRVFAQNNKCRSCGYRAEQIHHMSYRMECMTGEDLTPLIPLCDDCHEYIEFDGVKKRSVQEMQTFAVSWFEEMGKPLPESLVDSLVLKESVSKPTKTKAKVWANRFDRCKTVAEVMDVIQSYMEETVERVKALRKRPQTAIYGQRIKWEATFRKTNQIILDKSAFNACLGHCCLCYGTGGRELEIKAIVEYLLTIYPPGNV